MQHANGLMGAQIMNNQADSRVLGKDIAALPVTDRQLNDYMVAFMSVNDFQISCRTSYSGSVA